MWRQAACVGLVLLVSVCNASLPHGGKKWAVLVAGSNGYFNYRHQADICHAYQILHAGGIPDENIVVMMYDDIATNKENPTPGIIINEPGGGDVYNGVPKDYTGMAVNSSVFLAVLRGDKSAVRGIGSGRVIESGPYDHIFVNFVDHGAPGILAMPHDVVYATQLLETLLEMSANDRFAKLVLYVEACESGSMFDGLLPDDTNIFAVTAADPRESSYACYYDQERATYLGDLFSVMWMQDTEQENLRRMSFHHQFEVVRSRTNASHVEEYGDLDVGSSFLKDFIGYSSNNLRQNLELSHPGEDVMASRDVPEAVLQRKLAQETDKKKYRQIKAKLKRYYKEREAMERIFKGVVYRVAGPDSSKDVYTERRRLVNRVCYEQAVKKFDSQCSSIAKNSHGLSHLYLLVNLCERGHSLSDIISAMDAECPLT